MEPRVMKPIGLKAGRGFSLSEIQGAGLTIHQARTLGVYLDVRRRTTHEFNIQTLKQLMEERQKQLEEEVKRKELEKEETEEKEERKKTGKKEKKKETKEEKKEREKKEKKKAKEIDITELKGVGEKKAEKLKAAGISTVEDLLKANTEELAEETEFTVEYIEKLKEKAETL